MSGTALLEVRDLTKHFPVRGGILQTAVAQVRAVDGVSFAIPRGSVFGLAGESGSGKSTIARMVVGLFKPTAGEILLEGEPVGGRQNELAYRKQVQMVFQNPGSSLNPRRSIAQTLAVPLRFHGVPRSEWDRRIAQLLESVELPASFAGRYPHELSGGQKQRVAIARALAVEPSLVVLDEPTSALDVSVQAKIIELLTELAKQQSLTFLFISHDLSLMRNFADLVGVLYLGRLVETGPTEAVFGSPAHPYAQGLIRAVPVISEAEMRLKPDIPGVRGEIPSATRIPPGCSYHTRCPFVFDRCRGVDPAFRPARTAGHQARCHLLAAAS